MFIIRKPSFYLSILAGIFIAALSIYGFFLLRTRPGLPANIKAKDLVQIDDIRINKLGNIEFVLTLRKIGDWGTFIIRKDGSVETIKAQFIAFYSTVPFPLIYLFSGVFCMLIGFVVAIHRWEDHDARILYWLALIFAFLLIVSGGTYCLRKEWLSYLPAILFYLLYPLAPALLLHFSLSFFPGKSRFRPVLIYGLPAIFSVVFASTILVSTLKLSLKIFRFYISAFYVFRFYVIFFLLLALFLLIHAFRRTILAERKAQVKWVFLGLAFGLGPFILFYQLPRILGLWPLISEETSSVFFILIPLGFALSIFKFRLLDVDLVINRGLVYSLLTIFTASLYFLSIRIFENLFSRMFTVKATFVALGSAVLAAVLFHPARKRIQEFVDKAFFRQVYDYRKAIQKFNEMAQKALSKEELFDIFLVNLNQAIPLEGTALSIWAVSPSGDRPLLSKDSNDGPSLPLSFGLPSVKVWAKHGATNTEDDVDFSQDNILSERKLALVLPFPFESTSLNGYLALGRKKSGERFASEDIDLLETLVGELSLNVERIRLHEEVIFERASKEKLDELNRLKTEFISTVSHELRTPMSSIQGLSEILQQGKIKDKAKRKELLAVVASESGRLSRLIHNILDFGKIEQDAKTYHFQRTEITPLIKEAVDIFRFKLDAEGFALRLELPRDPVGLDIDRDAVKQALINLIDNAMKYSTTHKEIEIRLLEKQREAEIQIKDQGIGIAPEEQEKIFDKYYRAAGVKEVNPKGVGLGLKIVKHIMAAHKGSITVESRPGQGSAFKLIFPKP